MTETAVASHWCSLEWAPLESWWYVKIIENEQLATQCSLNHLIRIKLIFHVFKYNSIVYIMRI